MAHRDPDQRKRRIDASPTARHVLTRERGDHRGPDAAVAAQAQPRVPIGKMRIEDLLPELETADRKYILGDYQLIRPVGRGGMGVVYEARQLSLHKRVAVKTLPISSVLEQRLIKRFQNEAWAAARLDHPNIVPVYHVGCERGIHFYVMQFVEGSDLARVIDDLRARRQPLKMESLADADAPDTDHTGIAYDDVAAGEANGAAHGEPSRVDGLPPAGESAKLPSPHVDDSGSAATHSFVADLATAAQPQPQGGSTQRSTRRESSTLVSEELKSVVSRYGSTSHPAYIKILLKIGIQAAEALDYAHQMGVVHRDIKPSNLMLDMKGNLWVTDFGLAQIENAPSVTATGDIVGTLRYMSPEQAFGKRVVVDHRTDIYSLGVTLYELLTLEAAFGAENREAILRKIAFDDPVAPRKIDHRIPVELETIVMKALSKSPDERYQTAAELAEDLKRFRDDEPICGRRPSFRQRGVRWAKRHRSAAVAAAGLSGITFISAILIAVLSWSYYNATAAMLETEQEQNVQLERSLRKSEGLRLAANASLQLPDNPGRSLALALQGAERYVSSETDEAVLAALGKLHEVHTFLGHETFIGSVAVNPDGTQGVSTATRLDFNSGAWPARLWNLETGESAGVLQDQRPITSAVFSPDRFRILTTASPPPAEAIDDIEGARISHRAQLWDGITRQKLVSFPDAFLFEAHQGAFDPTGRRIVLPAYGNLARVYDSVGGHEIQVFEGHRRRVVYAAFDPTGNRVVTASDDQTVRVWDVASGGQIWEFDLWKRRATEEEPSAIDTIHFSPDGTQLATGSKRFGVQLWNLEDGTRLNDDFWPGTTVGYAPDGRHLLIRSQIGQLQWRSALTGDLVRTIDDPLGAMDQAVLSPDGETATTFGPGNDIRVFDLETAKLRCTLKGHESRVMAAAYLPGGKGLLSAALDRTVRQWDLLTEVERASLPVHLPSDVISAVSEDARFIAVAQAPRTGNARLRFGSPESVVTGDGRVALPNPSHNHFLRFQRHRVELTDATSGEQIAIYTPSEFSIRHAVTNEAADCVAIVTDQNRLMLWYPDEDRVVAAGIIFEPISVVTFSKGEHLAVGDVGGKVRLWDIDSGQLLTTFQHDAAVSNCDFSPDGKLLLVSSGGIQATVWDIASSEQRLVIDRAQDRFNDAVFSFDGQYILTSHSSRSTGISCWNAATGELVSRLAVELGPVHVAVNPQRNEAAVASDPSGVLFWNYLADDHRVLSDAPAAHVGFSADGEYFVSVTTEIRFGSIVDASFVPAAESRAKFKRWHREALDQVEEFDSGFAAVQGFAVVADGWLVVNYQRYGVGIYQLDTLQRVTSVAGHGAPVRYLAFLPGGNQLVSASWDHTAAVWDRVTGERRVLMDGHSAPITVGNLSVDGRRLLTSTTTGETIFWNTQSGRALHTFRPVLSAAIGVQLNHVADSALVIGSGGEHAVYHLADQRTVQVPDSPERIRWAEFSPDGQRILYVPAPESEPAAPRESNAEANGGLKQPAASLIVAPVNGTDAAVLVAGEPVVTAQFHPQGTSILLLRGRIIEIIDATSGQTIRQWRDFDGLTGAPTVAATFSPDGKLVVSASPEYIRVWESASGRVRYTLNGRGVSSIGRHTFRPIDPTNQWLFSTYPERHLTRWPLVPAEYGKRVAPRAVLPHEERRFNIRLLGDAAQPATL